MAKGKRRRRKRADESEARTVLATRLSALRRLTYGELVDRFLGKVETEETVAASGRWYQIEIQGFWDSRPGGNLRVMGSIDEGKGWRAFKPLTDDFIIAPDGSFVGE